MGITNQVHMEFDAKSLNESFARMTVAAFMMDMNPTLEQLQDVKTAVSEAVTNAIIHGYCEGEKESHKFQNPKVEMYCFREEQKLVVTVIDHGVGIFDVEAARQPFFTTKSNMERSGMGFAFMESFMDNVEVFSKIGIGTRVTMTKYIERDSEE